MPAARLKRTGGLSITRQPLSSISTARQLSSQRSRYSLPSCPPTRMKTVRSGPSKCAFASMTLSADCSASEFGAFPVSSKKRRASQRLNHLVADRPGLAMAIDLQIGVAGAIGCVEQVSLGRKADQDVGLLGRSPPVSPLSSARTLSSSVTRQPACLSCARRVSKAARSLFLRISELFEHLWCKRRAGVRGSPFHQAIQRIADLLGPIDGGTTVSSASKL